SICCLFVSAKAQKNDYHYLNRVGSRGGIQLSWNESESRLETSILDVGGDIAGPAMIISNSGQMLGYFNCINLFDSLDRLAINGEDFNLKGFTFREIFVPIFGENALLTGQLAAVLPFPNDSLFVLINSGIEF